MQSLVVGHQPLRNHAAVIGRVAAFHSCHPQRQDHACKAVEKGELPYHVPDPDRNFNAALDQMPLPIMICTDSRHRSGFEGWLSVRLLSR